MPGVVDASAGATEAGRLAATGAVASLIDRSGVTVADVRAVEAAWLLAEGKAQLVGHVMSTGDRNAVAVAFDDGYSATLREVSERPDIVAAARAEAREARDRMIARLSGEMGELDEPAQRMREKRHSLTRVKGFVAGRVAYLSALSQATDIRRGGSDPGDPGPVGVRRVDTAATIAAVEDEADLVGPPDPYPAESAVLAEQLAGLMAEADGGEWTGTRWEAARSAWEVAEAAARDADEWLHTLAAEVEEGRTPAAPAGGSVRVSGRRSSRSAAPSTAGRHGSPGRDADGGQLVGDEPVPPLGPFASHAFTTWPFVAPVPAGGEPVAEQTRLLGRRGVAISAPSCERMRGQACR